MAKPARALEGADDGLTAAFELVLTPALFAFFGYLVDRWLGTTPLFIPLLAGIVAAYEVWKLVTNYNARMRSHESSLPRSRQTDG